MKLKFLLFSALAVFFTTNVNAQIKKGSIFLGGSIDFYTQKSESPGTGMEPKYHSFGVSPAIGKAIKDNFIVGIETYFSSSESNGSVDYRNNSKMAGGGFFARKYAPLGKGFSIFGHGGIGAGWSKVSQWSMGSTSKTEGYNINFRAYPGIAYNVNHKLQLEVGFPNLIYANYTNDEQNGARTKTFNIGSSVSNFGELRVGVRFLLNNSGN